MTICANVLAFHKSVLEITQSQTRVPVIVYGIIALLVFED